MEEVEGGEGEEEVEKEEAMAGAVEELWPEDRPGFTSRFEPRASRIEGFWPSGAPSSPRPDAARRTAAFASPKGTILWSGVQSCVRVCAVQGAAHTFHL